MKPVFSLNCLSFVLMGALLTVTGCNKDGEKRGEITPTLPTAKVRAQKVELTEIAPAEEVVGTVRAKERATIEAKISGRIDKLPVSVGEKLRRGDLVARLDSLETAARLEQAQASFEQAERDWRRTSALFERQSATRAENEASEARLRVAKAAVAEAKASLGYAEIAAPFDGVVTKKWADVGDLAMPGKPIVDVENAVVLQVEFDLPEGLEVDPTPGREFDVLGTSGVTAKGILREVAPSVDPITRTRKLKLDLGGSSSVSSGQFVRVSVPLGKKKTLIVPKNALVQRGQLQMVFSVENERARMRLVKTGRNAGADVEVLSGLQPQTTVVIEGAEGLTDGQPLQLD